MSDKINADWEDLRLKGDAGLISLMYVMSYEF